MNDGRVGWVRVARCAAHAGRPHTAHPPGQCQDTNPGEQGGGGRVARCAAQTGRPRPAALRPAYSLGRDAEVLLKRMRWGDSTTLTPSENHLDTKTRRRTQEQPSNRATAPLRPSGDSR